MNTLLFDRPAVLPADLREIAALFSAGEVAGSRYLGGIPNVTWSVDLGSESLAIRICNRGYTSQDHLRCEVALLLELEKAGYPYSPRLKLAGSGDAIAAWRGYPVIATHLITGESADSALVTPGICHEIGVALGAFREAVTSLSATLPASERFDRRGRRYIQMLPKDTSSLAWHIDPAAVSSQLEDSLTRIMQYTQDGPMQLIHADVKPANAIIRQDHLVGLVDFDDLAIGPPVVDLAVALAEFALDPHSDAPDHDNVRALLNGYRSVCAADEGEIAVLVPCMVFIYASWLACNALYKIPYSESEVIDRRLRRFRDVSRYREVAEAVEDLWPG